MFVPAGKKWHELFTWKAYDAVIKDDKGRIVFEQKDVLFPENWDQNSVNIVAQKYFYGDQDKAERESSLVELITRVCGTIRMYVEKNNLSSAIGLTSDQFFNELAYLIADQRFSFNSPVWFNVGIEPEPQTSACFILSVKDTMQSITDNVKTEMMIFKHGSGCGSNRAALRSKREKVRGGGKASGPMSFIKVYDAGAGGIKSGGKTRRAAKMEILDIDHLDILDFIRFKRDEEKKAKILIDGGIDGSFCGDAYSTVSGQNANYSVRVNDDFMAAVRNDCAFNLVGRHDKITETVKAKDLWNELIQCAWECADPGIQFDGAIQKMHTCAADGRINATNPCSEYVFLDDTSCNLASHNLLSYLTSDGKFLIEEFKYAVSIATIAMDSFIDFSSFPTEEIKNGTRRYRTLGIGYSGLGAFLMCLGVPYASVTGRNMAAAITSLMSAVGYETSHAMAKVAGSFDAYKKNQDSFFIVMMHHYRAASELIDSIDVGISIAEAAGDVWQRVASAASIKDGAGFRNAQISVLAPTGTISFMMGLQASTGIEPMLGLVTYKNLAGGGVLKQVNPWVTRALQELNYSEKDTEILVKRVETTGSFVSRSVGDVTLKDKDIETFLTSFPDPVTGVCLSWKDHIDMMAACQPFLSGAISKTVNMPESATQEDISNAYMYAYEKGLKCVAIYRDNCKAVQAIGTSLKTGSKEEKQKESVQTKTEQETIQWGHRQRLPHSRNAVNVKFAIGQEGHQTKGFLTVGVDEHGKPKELFTNFDKVGGTVQGFVHAWCKSMSYNLQLGMSLEELIDAHIHTKFEPSGPTRNPDIPTCSSIPDFVAKWLMLQFMPDEFKARFGSNRPVRFITRIPNIPTVQATKSQPVEIAETSEETKLTRNLEIPCSNCGTMMRMVGSCHMCPNCATTTGCS